MDDRTGPMRRIRGIAAGVIVTTALGTALRYNIVRERYLEGKEVKQIYMRRDVAERTFHRYRRDGTRAIAQELRDQEQRLARDRGSDAAFG